MGISDEFGELLDDIIEAISICSALHDTLNNLGERIDNLKLSELNNAKLKAMREEFSACINKNLLQRTGRDAAKISSVYMARIMNKDYAFQGGFGHTVEWVDAHHWVIHPEYYAVCLPTNIEKLAMLVAGRRIKINKRATQQHWGN